MGGIAVYLIFVQKLYLCDSCCFVGAVQTSKHYVITWIS
jgi:hypothetical protein